MNVLSTIGCLLRIITIASAIGTINPIEIQGRQFVDAVTKERFMIKGIDYQPGGSSGYIGRSDPLSDINTCARDIYLFQQLGINALRVYTVNPDLNHDECMSLLAAAGIYLVLDVNSPKVGESLNRYEPWTSYTPDYLTHILKVVDQFSGYNNTLGFFAGNEVVNDDKSATNSPHYVKAVIRDIKNYIRVRAPRTIPVGYSAADDLRYRVSLARYLECGDDQSSVDFYGVNSYQWCGTQTLQTSGYDVLLNDYHNYALPLFFSEYGCNAVLPRQFQEVECLYTSMTSVFSGGLVYEFTQEPNNYGLVETDTNGKVFLLPDFHKLKERYAKVRDIAPDTVLKSERPRQCLDSYDNLNTRNAIPDTFASKLIAEGAPVKRGRFLPVKVTATSLDIIDVDDSLIANKQIEIPDDWKRETPVTAPRAVADLGSRDGEKPHPVAPIPLITEHFSSTAQMVVPYISSIMAVILTWGWLLIKGYI